MFSLKQIIIIHERLILKIKSLFDQKIIENGNEEAVFNFDLITAFEVTVKLADSFRTLVVDKDSMQDNMQDNMQDTIQVSEQVKVLLKCMNGRGEFSREELQQALELKNSDNFRKNYLRPALDLKLIEMTIPDKPTSKLQGYRLTEKGRQKFKILKNKQL